MQKPAARSATHPVGQKQLNPWGLHDLLGNVYEWCGDWYGEYDIKMSADPSGPASGQDRVVRGGAWYSNARRVRAAGRSGWHPGNRDRGQGFRLVRRPDL
jgi:sulfatase modifying factor 1